MAGGGSPLLEIDLLQITVEDLKAPCERFLSRSGKMLPDRLDKSRMLRNLCRVQ